MNWEIFWQLTIFLLLFQRTAQQREEVEEENTTTTQDPYNYSSPTSQSKRPRLSGQP